jgi:hypothetical protein
MNFKDMSLMLEFDNIKAFELSPGSVLKALASASVGFVLYKALRIYFMRRRYSHIPGPNTHGFKVLTSSCRKKDYFHNFFFALFQ